MTLRHLMAGALLLGLSATGQAAPAPADPLNSVQWPVMYQLFMHDAPVVFDARVQLQLPSAAEDSLLVPVALRYSGIESVQRVLVLIDFNPIPQVLELKPHELEGYLAFRVRVQQSTPIRAAVLDGQGTWHVGGAWVEAAGGACTLPPNLASRVADEQIGHLSGRVWSHDGLHRLKLQVQHPNDTGLIANIPPFYLEQLTIQDQQGHTIAELHTYQPLSESPMLSLETRRPGPYSISGRDNSGTRIQGVIQP